MNENLINADNLDPHEILNVSQNASIDEIRKARNRLAREFHPDKGFANQNIMGIINKAFKTLTDPDEKKKFYEKAETENETDNKDFKHGTRKPDLLCLKGYEFRSKKYMQLIDQYRKEARSINLILKASSSASFEDIVTESSQYVNERELYFDKDIKGIFDEISVHLIDPEKANFHAMFDYTDYEKIVLSNRVYKSKKIVDISGETCLVDLSGFDLNLLEEFLIVLDGDFSKNHKKLYLDLKQILPKCKIELRSASPISVNDSEKCFGCKQKKKLSLNFIKNLFDKFLNECMWCGEWFCSECLIDSFKLPRLGFSIRKLCTNCVIENSEWEIEQWLDVACSSMNMGMIKQGISLFRMALNFQNYTETNLFDRMLFKLNRKPELAVLFLFDVLVNRLIKEKNLHENYLIQFANNLCQIADHQTDSNKIYELNAAAIKTLLIVEDRSFARKDIDRIRSILCDLTENTIKQNKISGFDAKTKKEINAKLYTQDHQQIIDYFIGCKKVFKEKLAYKLFFDSENLENLVDYMRWPFLLARGIYRIFYGESLNTKLVGFRDVERAFWNKWTFKPEFLASYLELIVQKAANAGIPFPLEAVVCDYKKNFQTILPLRNEFEPVKKRFWPTMILNSRSLKYMKRYEDAIHYNHSHKLMNWSHMKSVLSYIDLIDGCGSIYEIVFCFLHAASWCLAAMDSCVDPVEIYTMNRIIFKCINDAVSFAHAFLDFTTKSCVFRHAFGIAYYANVFNSNEDVAAIRKYLKLYIFSCSILPWYNVPFVQASEAVLLKCQLNEISSKYFEIIQLSDISLPVREHLAKYIRFENVQYGISETDKQEEIKLDAMHSLLKDHGLTWENVRNFLEYHLVKRSNEGWLLSGEKLSISNKEGKFYRFDGFVINKKTHDIQLLAAKEPILASFGFSMNKTALFTWHDIATILANLEEISVSYFSLDPVDEKLHLHPFQCFDYKPKCLHGSLFLHTLFHTDYLLKQFAMGVEVSSEPPFKQKLASRNGLYKGLDEKLFEALKPIYERGDTYHKCGRLWIQADELEHQIVDTEDEIKFLFGELKMSVRTHPMFTDSEGRLVDTIEDADKNGPEACFAKDFTNNYNEISKNFREFARLKELCKLQYMGIFIKNYKKHLIESEQKLLADDYKINQIYEEKRSELESKIENILNEIKQKVSYSVSDAEVSAVNQALNSSFNFYEFNLVENWLKYGGRYKNELIDALASKKELTKFEIRDLIQKQFRSRELNDKVEDLKRTSKEVLKESYLSWPDKTEWVPSLFRNKNLESAMNFIYGGVLLQPHLKETKLNGNSYTRFEINQTQLLENRISHSRQQTESYQLNLAQSPSSTLTTTSGWSGDLYQMKRKMIEYKWDIKNFAQANLGVYNKATNKHEFDSNASMKFESQFKLLSSHICEKSDSNILLRQVTRDEARKEFNIKRASLIKEWEKHWGCPWPKTEAGNYYEAHHIIPLDKFPCNKWFNIMPLTLKQHRGPGKTGSIHHGSHLNDIEEFLDFQRDTYNKDYKKK